MSGWATVSPARLAEALHQKLYEATIQLAEVRKAEQPEINNADGQAAVNHFVASARGVCPVAETFGKQELPKGAFVAWRDKWEARLSREDMTLWNHMREQREAREHGDGPALEVVEISLPQFVYQPNAMIFGLNSQTRCSKGGVRFKAYMDQLASDVCQDYLNLCNRFVADFLHDHAAIISSRTPTT